MKKILTVLLLVALLMEALPLSAFAKTGEMITEAELERAYALAGTNKSANYHSGMKFSASMDGWQIYEWLDEQLSGELYSVSHTLGRAKSALMNLERGDQAGYRHFTNSPLSQALIDRCDALQLEAEDLRETMRFNQDRLYENLVMIEQSGKMLNHELTHDFEAIRYSERIKAAAQTVTSIRQEVLDEHSQWLQTIDRLQSICDSTYEGSEEVDKAFGGWIDALFRLQSAPHETQVTVTTTNGSASLASRLRANESVLTDEAESSATLHVMTSDTITVVIKDPDKNPFRGAKVSLGDLTDHPEDYVSEETDEQGIALFSINNFVVNDDGILELDMEVEANDPKYRDFRVEHMTIEKGEIRTEYLEKDDGTPYAWMATFEGYDILRSEHKVIHSPLNDENFSFCITMRGDVDKAPILCWESKDGFVYTAEADSVRDKTYVFSRDWKCELNAKNAHEVYFRLGKRGKKISTLVKLVDGLFDKPIDISNTLTDYASGLGISLPIPFRNWNIGLDFKWSHLMPKITVHQTGWALITIGCSGVSAKNEEWKSEWKSKSWNDWEEFQNDMSREGSQKSFKEKFGASKDELEEARYKSMSKIGITFGMFAVVMAKWKDSEETDKTPIREVSFSAAFGGTLVVYGDWTFMFMMGSVPAYVDVNISLAVSAATNAELEFRFKKDKSSHWHLTKCKFYPIHDITLDFRLTITMTLGIGIKGVASVWISGAAYIDVLISVILGTMKASGEVKAGASVTLGATILLATLHWTVWSGGPWKIASFGNGDNSLMDVYMRPALAPGEDKSDDQQLQEPETYPELEPVMVASLSEMKNAHDDIKLLQLGDDFYAFFIQDRRIHWYNLTKNTCGSIQDSLTFAQKYYDNTFDVVNMYDYDFDVAVGFGTADVPMSENWRMDEYIAVAGLCAADFDDNGNPAGQSVLYTLLLWRVPDTGELRFAVNGFYLNNCMDISAYRAVAMGGEKGTVDYIPTSPQIMGTTFTYKRLNELTRLGTQINFTAEVAFKEYLTGDSGAAQALGDVRLSQQSECDGWNYVGKHFFRVMPKWETFAILKNDVKVRQDNVASGAGDDYKRIYSRYLDADSWVAVSRSKGGEGDEAAIEWYDYAMTGKSVVLAKGNMDAFALLPGDVSKDGFTLFYIDNECGEQPAANDDEEPENCFRMHGLRVEPYGNLSEDFKLNVTETSYDVDISTQNIKAQNDHGQGVVYWLCTAPDRENGKKVWRINFCDYDIATNTMADNAVYAEFSLPEKSGTETSADELFLGEDGKWYLIATQTDQSSGSAQVSLYTFPVSLQPILDLQGTVIENLLVRPGDFDDITLTVMNSGNLAVTGIDLKVYIVDSKGKKEEVETLHSDCLHPEKSALIMNGRDVIKGEKACYRLEDFDYTPRQRDFVLKELRKVYTVKNGALDSVKEDSEKSEYVTSKIIMPGALAGFKGALKIPDEWQGGDYTIEMTVEGNKTMVNWVGAMAGSAGRNSLTGTAPADDREFTYVRDEDGTMKLVDTNTGDDTYQPLVAVLPKSEPVEINGLHDLDVNHRVYMGPGREKMLSVALVDHAHTGENISLYAEVYPDDEKTPYYVDMKYYSDAVSDNTTHTYDMPLTALVDPSAYQKARVVIRGKGINEPTLLNNEFTLYLDGEADPLTLLRQPRDVTIQEGESASFEVKVTGGVPPYSYQWQMWDAKHKKWVDIPGATDSVLSREHVEKKWDGAQFRCVITDRAETTVISDVATLHVRDSVDTGDYSNLPLYLTVAAIALTLMWLLRRRARRVK